MADALSFVAAISIMAKTFEGIKASTDVSFGVLSLS